MPQSQTPPLLVVLLLGIPASLASSGGLGPLPLRSAGTTTAVGRVEGVVNVLLGSETHDKGWDVDDLLADADVPLADEDTGVVDRLGESGMSAWVRGLGLMSKGESKSLMGRRQMMEE
jgi:hypothetical protein